MVDRILSALVFSLFSNQLPVDFVFMMNQARRKEGVPLERCEKAVSTVRIQRNPRDKRFHFLKLRG